MLKNNLKLAFRNIFRNKLYTAINIIGLGVASAFCILVYLYVKNERSFDSFHNDNASLFRVEESRIFGGRDNDQQEKSFFSFLTTDADQQNMIQTPLPFGPDLKKNFPEIPVEMLDERFTSKMASAVIAQSGMGKKDRQNKALVDTISATILLQSWMEKKAFG